MKRTLLDITKQISRSPKKVNLIAKNLDDTNYWIFEAKGWRFVSILREIEVRTTQDRLTVYINTQSISARDYIVEEAGGALLLKFIKSNFEYILEDDDYIEIEGDIEQYA
jgi:hypothetical protein